MNRRFLPKEIPALFLFLLFTGCPPGFWGQDILGPQTSYAQSFCEHDVTGDGDVDGSDLAVFSDKYGGGLVDGEDLAAFAAYFGNTDCLVEPAQVSFKEVRSSAEEGASVDVILVFSKSFSGQVTLVLSGTAGDGDHGLSCTGGECTASVTGSGEVTFTVPIADDMDIEEVEWLGLRLKAGPGYTVGSLGEHVITIEDNDAVWEGIFTSNGEELGFSIEILRSGSGVTATLLGEGAGIIPAGAKSVDPEGIPFSLTFDLDSKTFSGTLPYVPLPISDTLLGTEGSLRLVLEAAESTGGVSAELVEGRNDLGSTTQMEIVYTEATHLNSTVPGSFVLQRRPAKPSTAEVPLEDINN